MPGHADERLQLTRSASERTALPRSIFGPRSLPMKHGPLDAKLPSLLVVCHPSRTLLHVDAGTTSPLFRCQACHTPPRDDSIKAVPESNPFPLPCKSSEVLAASTAVSAPSRPCGWASAATTLPTQKGSQVLPPRGVTAQDPRKHSKASAVWASARLFLQPDSTLPPFHSYPQTHSKNWEGGRGGERVCFLHTTVSYFLSCSVYQNFTRQCGDQRWSFHSGSQPGVILLFLGGLARSRDISGCHA